jgi:hypothetical protein
MKKFIPIALLTMALVGSAFAKKEKAEPIVATPKMVQQAAAVIPAIRNRMRDPDSFIFEEASIVNRGKIVENTICLFYRSKNGYGGYNRESAQIQLADIYDIKGKLRLASGTVIQTPNGDLVGCGVGRFDGVTDITAEVKAALAPPAESAEDKAKRAQQYADCLKLLVDNPKVVCKQ